MITTQHIQEGLSRAYVQAVAARAGLNIGSPQLDYGVDGTFGRIHTVAGRRLQSGIYVDFQLKSTFKWRTIGADVSYDLEAKTYNDLINRNERSKTVPLLLILLCLPRNTAEWLEITEESLVIRRCCYWALVTGEPTRNKRAKRIKIPKSQVLTPDALNRLLDAVEKGVLP